MDFRKPGFVSIWICRNPPEDVNYDPLKIDFGIEYYDIDELEPVGSSEGLTLPIKELLSQLSFSDSFLASACKRAEKLNALEGVIAIALFEFAYDPEKAGVELPADPIFLGSFAWNDGH